MPRPYYMTVRLYNGAGSFIFKVFRTPKEIEKCKSQNA